MQPNLQTIIEFVNLKTVSTLLLKAQGLQKARIAFKVSSPDEMADQMPFKKEYYRSGGGWENDHMEKHYRLFSGITYNGRILEPPQIHIDISSTDEYGDSQEEDKYQVGVTLHDGWSDDFEDIRYILSFEKKYNGHEYGKVMNEEDENGVIWIINQDNFIITLYLLDPADHERLKIIRRRVEEHLRTTNPAEVFALASHLGIRLN